MADPAPRPQPAPPSTPPRPTLYSAELDRAAPPINDKPGDEELDFKSFSWRVSWHEQECDAIRSPRFEVGGHQWSLSVRPNRELETGLVSIILNHESSNLLTGPVDHVCARLAITMTAPGVTPSPRSPNFVERGAYRFTANRKLYGFPSFGVRKDLVKWCVGADDDSIITVYLKVLKDESGYCLYRFSQARYDSRERTGLVSLRKFDDFTDVGFLHLWSIPEIRKLVYELPDLPDSPTGKMNLCVCSLQALFYALEVAERAVSTEPTVNALKNRAVTFGVERAEAVRFAYDALNDCQLPGAPSRQLFRNLLSSRTLRKNEEGSFSVDYVDTISIAAVRRFCANDLISVLNRRLKSRPSLTDLNTDDTSPQQDSQLALFDLSPFLTFELGPPGTSGSPAPRFTFPTHLNMTRYLPYTTPDSTAQSLGCTPSRQSSSFRLHTVIVQLPDLNYPNLIKKGKRVHAESYAFVRPEPSGPWYRHRDERVVIVTEKEVLESAFGGRGIEQTKEFGVATTLVYADVEFEKRRGDVKMQPVFRVREWVKRNLQIKKGESSNPFSWSETLMGASIVVGVAAVGVGLLTFGLKAAMRWRRS